jgi:tetratricopeptide (TPR) repeat protein
MTDAPQQRWSNLIQQGSFYEAEQLCTALHHRLFRAGKKQEALECLLQGARDLAKSEQFQCAIVLLEKAQEYMRKHYFSEESLSQVATLLASFPNTLKAKLILGNKLERLATEKRCSETILYDLYKLEAETCVGMGDYRRALSYYGILSDSQQYLLVLKEWMSHGLPSEEDLFVTRQVLWLLLSQKLHFAKQILQLYLQQYNNNHGKGGPLLDFVYLLLECLERRLFSSVEYLKTIYKPAIDRDPHLWKLLQEAIEYKRKHS